MSKTSKDSKVGPWALIVKFGGKFLAFLPKLMKFAKLIKVGLFLISFASYAYLFTWKFALLIMLAVGFHEQCHCIAMRKVGIPTKGFYFLPFLGGVALADSHPKTFAQWCFVALAGPGGGFLLALATYVVFVCTGLPMFAAAASWMALLNLINLLPVSPLDGHHVLKAISISLHKERGIIAIGIVYGICIAVLVHLKIWLFVIFGVIGLAELIFSALARKRDKRLYNAAMEEAYKR